MSIRVLCVSKSRSVFISKMKLLCAVLCAFLLAGPTYAETSITVIRAEGEEYGFTILALPHTIQQCSLVTPAGAVMDFQPDVPSVHGDRYQLQPIQASMPACTVTVHNLQGSDSGEWMVSYLTPSGAVSSARFDLTVNTDIANRPQYVWNTRIQGQFDHPVHIGSTLRPVVLGSGEIVSCHVVTPNGEDLVVSHDSEYPGIRADHLAHSTCGVAIGPIDNSMLSNWTVYGLFRNAVSGLDEVHLPIKMFLYDEENPSSQAYNVTVHEPLTRVVNLGNTLNVVVYVNVGQVDDCRFETPWKQIYSKEQYSIMDSSISGAKFVQDDENTGIACRVAIGPITAELLGDWTLTGKFSNNGLFNEVQQTFNVIQEDPENPIEEDRTINYLNAQIVNTAIGGTHPLVISSDVLIHAESCQIRTPGGLQYILMDGFSLPGITIMEEPGVDCGVTVHVLSEDVVGEWTLIARATRHSEPIERRLPFTIYVEESVEALVNEITAAEGSDLYFRLEHPTDQYQTCKLIGPYGFECPSAIPDPLHVETCGFIRKNVQSFNSGTWSIMYGNRIVYKAEIDVTVNSVNTDIESTVTTTLDLVLDSSIKKTVGPENAVYCRLEDPQGLVVFDGFGKCTLTLDKVGSEHDGIWKMIVGAANKVLTDEHQLLVNVVESAGKTVVTTHVEKTRPLVTVTCSVASASEVRACKFRNPQGKILLAASGASEDRYEGSVTSYGSEVRSHECSIRFTDPAVSDLGLWRCAIETAEDTYYGHMLVMCPWVQANQPDVVAIIQQEPLLTSDRPLVSVVDEEPASMSCSVQSAIRYCYFRAANGTIFTVSPGMSSSSMEYIGAGFDAGECGVRFHGMHGSDSGRWSCHVGLVGDHAEQRVSFQLTVHDRMTVNHYYSHANVMVVEGTVYERRALEYCRFVRIDGFGFTTDSVPSEYTLTGIIANGECQFTARNPTILDLHPWTVVARIRGQDVEIAKDTMEAVLISPPTTDPTPEQPGAGNNPTNALAIIFYVFMSLLLAAIVFGVFLGPKENRDWTAQRAAAFRRSLSSSFRKEQPMPTPTPNRV